MYIKVCIPGRIVGEAVSEGRLEYSRFYRGIYTFFARRIIHGVNALVCLVSCRSRTAPRHQQEDVTIKGRTRQGIKKKIRETTSSVMLLGYCMQRTKRMERKSPGARRTSRGRRQQQKAPSLEIEENSVTLEAYTQLYQTKIQTIIRPTHL